MAIKNTVTVDDELLQELEQASEQDEALLNDLEEITPLRPGKYFTMLTEVKSTNGRLLVSYKLTDKDGHTYDCDETYSASAVKMFKDKLAIIATRYNKKNGIADLYSPVKLSTIKNSFTYIADVSQNVSEKDGRTYVNWAVTPIPPKKEE